MEAEDIFRITSVARSCRPAGDFRKGAGRDPAYELSPDVRDAQNFNGITRLARNSFS